jgi:DNA-binding response OmpR family regulator
VKQRILVYEGNDNTRKFVVYDLIANHFAVMGSDKLAECRWLAAKHQPDLIIMAFSPLFVEGWATVQLLARQPETEQIPVLLVTSTDWHRLTGMRPLPGNIRHVLPQPFTNQTLVKAVRHLLSSKSEQHSGRSHLFGAQAQARA